MKSWPVQGVISALSFFFFSFIYLQLEDVKNTLTSPKSKDGLKDTKYRDKETFNDGFVRSGVWWAGIPIVVTTSNLFPNTQVPIPSSSLAEYSGVVVQSCLTLCDPMHYTIHGILQTRIREWVAFPFSRGSSQPRDRTQVSCIAGGFFTN